MHFGAQNQDENETECSISHKPSSLSAKEKSHSSQKSCNTWTEPTSEIPRDFAEATDRSDRRIFVEKYNILASKHGVRLMFSCIFKSSTDNLKAIPARRHSWFSRKILRRQSSTENVRDKGDRYLRHKRSFSELSLIFRSRKDKLKGKNLQELGRLCGVSLLYLPSEFTAGNLFMPTCFRAMAQYLIQNGTTTNGIFRISGSQDSVDDLYNYFCYPNERSEVVSGTVRSPTLPDHIKYDVYDVASAFKKFLIGLPGGILGSLSLFDAFISIKTQLDGDSETTGSETRSVRARLIALAILTSSAQYRRSLICAVFGLLCMIGDATESIKKENIKERPFITSDLMGYSELGVIFGPILTGDLLEDYTMRFVSPSEGIVLLPISPTKSRKERKVCSAKNYHNAKAYIEINKNQISSSITEMLITQWRDIVKHLKDLSLLDNSECIQKSNSFRRKYTRLRPRISNNFTLKGAPEINTTGTVTPEESESNDEALFIKKRKTSTSSSKQGLLASKSLSILSPTFEEAPIQKIHSQARKKPKDLQLSSSPSLFHKTNNEDIEVKYHHSIKELENLTHLDHKRKPKYSKITPTSPVFAEKVRRIGSPSNSLSERTEYHTKSDDKFRKSKNSSNSAIQIEKGLRSNSSTSSIKIPLFKTNSWNDGNNHKRDPPGSPHQKLSMLPHATSQSLVEAYPQMSHDILKGSLDIKTLAKNFGPQITSSLLYDESNINSDIGQISNHSAKTSKSRFNHEFLTPSRSLVEVTDACFDYKKNARVKDVFDTKKVGATITTSQNEKKVFAKSLNLTSKINDKIIFSNSDSRSTSHRSDKISELLAKFENNACGSTALPKTSNSLNTRRYSALSRDRPLSVYTRNSPSPTKSRMSVESDMKTQTTLGKFSMDNSPIINSGISQKNSIKSERYLYETATEKRTVTKQNTAKKLLSSLLTSSDATLSPPRSVKSSIEILNASTPRSFLNVPRSFSATRLLDKDLSGLLISPKIGNKNSQNLKQRLNSQNKLNPNMHPRLRKRLNKNSLLSYQSQDSLAQSLTGSYNHDTKFNERMSDPCQTSFVPITAPCSSNHMLFDQVRNLQRKLDKKNQEVYKLKQKLGTQEDILIGSITQELFESKKLVQYWQERAESFEKNLQLLSHTLLKNEPSQNCQKPTKFQLKDEVSFIDSDMHGFKTMEVAGRSPTPYLADSHLRTRSQSGYSGRTVIRNS
ncbi:hypothetical protein Golomagni_01950 [Golovinomyces magnicellulatus]|nr:hypothetical protein Golomagni_01950 [Golovinomyces magnicellulatus]